MKQSLDTRTKLLTKSPFPLMLELSIPAVLGMVVVGLYNMMDSIFVGQMVGAAQMGAVSVSYPFTLINAGSAAMLGVGSASVLSRAIGKKDQDTIKKIMGNLIAMVLLLSVIYTVIGMVFTRQLLSLAGASDNILNYAEKYLRIVFAGSLFVNFFQSANMVIRGEGQLKKAMAIIASGAILNIILDPIFIFVFHWGVKGAAWATIAGQILNAFLYFAYIWKFKSIKLDKDCFRISGKVMAKVSSLGISSFITQIAIVLVMAVTNNILVSYGAESKYGAEIPLTTIGITMKVNQIVSAVLLGLATGAQPIFGYNYGSGQKDRVKQAYRIILTVSTIVLILAFLVFQFAPMSIVRLFGSESELYNEFAVKCFRIFLLACPINGLQMATGIFFQSIGKPTQATVLSLSRQIVYLLPATILLPLSLGVEGALWAGPLADVLAFITTLIMLKLYWKKI